MKRLLAALCALAVALTLVVVPSSASNSLFFLSLNDTLPAQSTQITPIQYNGWIYVPVTVFSSRVTGINFGVYYGTTNNDESLIFYNLSGKTMTFDLVNGTATASSGETPVPGTILQRNGTYYAPAYAICRYFGLTYSYYTTEYGPLLRIKDGNAVLSDSLFISSASSIMRSRVNALNSSSSSTTPSTTTPSASTTQPSSSPSSSSKPAATTTPNTSVAPVQEETEDPAPVFSLTVGLKVGTGDITAALDALGSVGASAVVFFPADSILSRADELRQAAGRGHKIGLIPVGDTAAEQLASVEEGSRQIEKLLCQETWFVLSQEKTLTDAGYLSWSYNLSPASSLSADALYESITDYGADHEKGSRVLLQSTASSTVLATVLARLAQDGDTFLQPKETDY